MPKLLSGAEIVFKALEDQNVSHVFGYPGGAVLPIYDELKNHKSIKHILVRHEQGAGHAAEGYARSSGKPGVLLVTSGPGATNAVTALTDAYMDSVPLVCISGQVPTHLIGTDAFQEADATGNLINNYYKPGSHGNNVDRTRSYSTLDVPDTTGGTYQIKKLAENLR